MTDFRPAFTGGREHGPTPLVRNSNFYSVDRDSTQTYLFRMILLGIEGDQRGYIKHQ